MKQSRRLGHDAAKPLGPDTQPKQIQGVVVPEMPAASIDRPMSEILREQGLLADGDDPLSPPPLPQSAGQAVASPSPTAPSGVVGSSRGAIGAPTPTKAPAAPLGAQELLPMSQIDVSPYQPRMIFDQDALNSLTSTIELVGLNNPITVRRKDNGRYELIAGERRFRAFQLRHETFIPAFIRELGDKEAAILAMTDNDAREDLSDFERALGYKRLLDEGFVVNQTDLARCVGRSMATVSRCVAYFKLPGKVIDMLRANPGLVGTKVVADFVTFHEQGFTEQVITAVEKVEKGLSQENGLNWLKAEVRRIRNPVAQSVPRQLQLAGKAVAAVKIDGRNVILKCPKDVNPELLLRTIEKMLADAPVEDMAAAA